MIYPANFEQKVGFDRLREQVAALCTIRGGRERLCAEQFSTSQADVERRLALADEMRRLLEMEHDFPDDEFVDVDYILSKLKIEGSFLEVEEVVLLRRALASAGAIAGFILGRGEELYPELRLRSRGIEAFPEIVRAIDGIVDQYGKIRDDASPELQQIRRMILEREGQAAKRLQQVLSNAKKAGIVEADVLEGRTLDRDGVMRLPEAGVAFAVGKRYGESFRVFGCRQREVEIGRRVRIESYILRAGHRDGGADELCGTFAGSEIEAAGSQIAFRDFEVSGNGFSRIARQHNRRDRRIAGHSYAE